MTVVGVELCRADRPSFHQWWPEHLRNLNGLIDHLYLRVDTQQPPDLSLVPSIDYDLTVEAQNERAGKHFQEDVERDALLDWALGTEADWCTSLDADEVFEEGGAEALQLYLETDPPYKCFSFHLHYSSHHRPGYILPVAGKAWRLYRLDETARTWRFKSDADGLHTGSVPRWTRRSHYKGLRVPRIIHYHATTPEEWAAEKEFYRDTVEVANHGGIDWLYREDRFGKEDEAFPVEDLALDRDRRFAHLMGPVPA